MPASNKKVAIVTGSATGVGAAAAILLAEHGCNVVEYGGHVSEGMSRNWYVLEIGDLRTLKTVLTSLRQIESVVDAFRVTPGERT